jgi:Rap1a immunity proteins
MVVFAAGLALYWSPAAIADPVDALALRTGDDLYSVCRHEGEGSEMATGMAMACLAYIAAAVDCYTVTLCRVPKGTTRVRARDVVVTYLREHPKDRHDLAIRQIWLALAETWPCKK